MSKREILIENFLIITCLLSICGIVVSFLSMIPIMLNSVKIISLSRETHITILNSSAAITIISAIVFLLTHTFLGIRLRKNDSNNEHI